MHMLCMVTSHVLQHNSTMFRGGLWVGKQGHNTVFPPLSLVIPDLIIHSSLSKPRIRLLNPPLPQG